MFVYPLSGGFKSWASFNFLADLAKVDDTLALFWAVFSALGFCGTGKGWQMRTGVTVFCAALAAG